MITRRRVKLFGAVAAAMVMIAGGAVKASEYTWTFQTDPTTGTNPLNIGGNNPAMWVDAGGNPDGFLALTYPVGSQQGYALFPDIDGGKSIIAFELEADIRSGNSSGDRAADGWSVSLARSTDPVLVFAAANPGADIPGDRFGGAYEFGTTTGISVSFDTWAGNTLPDGVADIEGLIVRVDNKTIHTVALPTRHGTCEDDTSLQTGPRDPDFFAGGGDPYDPEAWSTLCWQPLRVVVTDTGLVSVYWKGRTVLENFQTDFFPSPGRVVLAARTGGANSNVHFDNLTLRTTVITPDTEAPTAPSNFRTTHVGAGSVGLAWDAATDNSGRVGYELQRGGVGIGGTLSGLTYTDTGVQQSTTYNYQVRATDIAGNTSAWVPLSATTVADVAGAGGVRGEIYDNLSGVLVYENFVQTPDWGSTPDRYVYLNGLSFGEWTGFGNTYGENFAFKVTGILTPPVTGNYYFFVRSDDGSEFHLNTSGTTPPNPLETFADATESGCCGAFEEPGAGGNTQVGYENTFPTSEPIALTAGTQYGFLWMVKEGGGGDWGQVAWRLQGDDTPAGQLGPIPGLYLSGSRIDPIGTTISISGPNDVTAVEGETVNIRADVTYQSPYPGSPWYQWQKNGVDIVGENSATLTVAATAAENGSKYSVKVGAFGLVETSQQMTLTVIADTFGPVPTAGAILSSNGTTVDVGVGWDEPVSDATASVQANYTISAGTISSFAYYPQSKSALLKVTGLAPGASGVVTVKNVADAKGNVTATADASFTVSETLSWGVVGGAELGLAGNYVVPVEEDGFDVFSNGMTEWATYDETTFVYEEITGDFDKKVQVVYQDQSSQWARAGLIARAVTNFGVDRDTQGAGEAGQYQKVHANPTGPTLTGPGTNGNNTYETNRRLTPGGATDAPGSASPVTYPDAWVRLQREGDTFRMYWGNNGTTWTLIAETTTFDPPMPETLFVGPEFSPENGNITNEADRGTWVAKFRNYGDTAGGAVPTVGISVGTGGNLTITFEGTLQSADSIGGTWTDTGLTSPATITPSGSMKIYRAMQ